MATTQSAHTRETLISRMRAIAAELGRNYVRRHEFERRTDVTRFQVIRLFGSYSAFTEAAGLAAAPNVRLDDAALLRSLRNACLASGGLVRGAELRRHGAYSVGAYQRRWGPWRNVLLALRHWAEQEDPDFIHLAALPRPDKDTALALLPRPAPPPRYGAPINFRGILHEPINEAGVIMLFGAMALDLGFAVERVVAAYPDCEAKRRTPQGWQRARIEFEYQSRNFEKHGHDPAGCDLIVCWEHNWVECPLEVLELKTEVEKRV